MHSEQTSFFIKTLLMSVWNKKVNNFLPVFFDRLNFVAPNVNDVEIRQRHATNRPVPSRILDRRNRREAKNYFKKKKK